MQQANIIAKEAGLLYAVKSQNKQLLYLYIKLYILGLTFVLGMKTYSSSLRLFTIDPFVLYKQPIDDISF